MLEERFAARQGVSQEVGFAVPADEKGEVSSRCRLAGHADLRPPPSRIARLVTTRSPKITAIMVVVVSPIPAPSARMRPSTMPSSDVGIIAGALLRSEDMEGAGLPTIACWHHFSRRGRTGTADWFVWYCRTIGGGGGSDRYWPRGGASSCAMP